MRWISTRPFRLRSAKSMLLVQLAEDASRRRSARTSQSTHTSFSYITTAPARRETCSLLHTCVRCIIHARCVQSVFLPSQHPTAHCIVQNRRYQGNICQRQEDFFRCHVPLSFRLCTLHPESSTVTFYTPNSSSRSRGDSKMREESKAPEVDPSLQDMSRGVISFTKHQTDLLLNHTRPKVLHWDWMETLPREVRTSAPPALPDMVTRASLRSYKEQQQESVRSLSAASPTIIVLAETSQGVTTVPVLVWNPKPSLMTSSSTLATQR